MNRIFQIVIVIVGVIFISSCSNPNRELLNEINSLQKQVDSLSKAYDKIDIDFFKEINAEIQLNMEFIQSNLAKVDMKDTIVSKYVGTYGTLWKTINRTFKRGGSSLESKLLESKKQIENLKYDVKNELVTNPEVIRVFMKSEAKEIERLKSKVKTTSEQFMGHREKYETLEPKIDEIIKNIKAQ